MCRPVDVRETGLTGSCRIPACVEQWSTCVKLGLMMQWTLGMASEALVMPAVSIICALARGANMWRRLLVDRWVHSGSILAVVRLSLVTVLVVLWTLCLLE